MEAMCIPRIACSLSATSIPGVTSLTLLRREAMQMSDNTQHDQMLDDDQLGAVAGGTVAKSPSAAAPSYTTTTKPSKTSSPSTSKSTLPDPDPSPVKVATKQTTTTTTAKTAY